jgi:hypothetical protein
MKGGVDKDTSVAKLEDPSMVPAVLVVVFLLSESSLGPGPLLHAIQLG